MRTSDVVALLDLLGGRGTVAWQLAGPTETGARLVVDASGLDSAMRLLISRGFVMTCDEVPSHVELAHSRHGRVVLLPCAFSGDGSASWHGAAGTVAIPAERFDALEAVPRRVDVVLPIPGLDPPALHPGSSPALRPGSSPALRPGSSPALRPGEGAEVVLGDEDNGAPEL